MAGQKEQCNILNFLHVVQVKQFMIPTSQTFKEGFSIDIACYVLFQLEILLIKNAEQLWNLQATLEILIALVRNKSPAGLPLALAR